ncbi:hypothetical protein [Lactobacillus mulieris]|uniref:hypothetical protein n=1 Tax=Lactobacillus mulieris TaxID=2508708 RepID=UPI0022ABE129|nr:hypothetical protein [Lactobacillus mulieris]MCZ3741107.1 hypothetical protein [Lactobacillus mulieris]MCZ3744826.1 hypothetical protein [Lactobacillus mulieris]MCZ3747945.1 hypothetical protein [Lactobacillus mulieris]MCZ3749263.1 hypothetical protein [Lactobacillus mulieris]
MLILDTLQSNYNRVNRVSVQHSGNITNYVFNEKELKKNTKNVISAVIGKSKITNDEIKFLANINTNNKVINLQSNICDTYGQEAALNGLIDQIKTECPELCEVIQKSVKGWD